MFQNKQQWSITDEKQDENLYVQSLTQAAQEEQKLHYRCWIVMNFKKKEGEPNQTSIMGSLWTGIKYLKNNLKYTRGFHLI